jgi:serine/threonine-protein kinase
MSTEHLKLVPAADTMPPDPLIGKVLDGRYQIEKVLGEGGMGLVYKARHVTLNKPLAIKVLKAEVSKDAEIVQRFRQEAQSATSIGNHHIIDISDFGALPDGSTYFVMEFLDGIPLTNAIVPGKPLPAARTIHIAKQICVALAAAHDIGIVHRDLKPDNIYLVSRGGDKDFVKVLDFGIAKVGGAKSKLTQVGQVFGTPHYMSPEQCAGTAVDKRTDVYALGVIMYEMTSSRVPFDADNLMGILTKHLYEEPIRPHELPPPVDVPASLEAVIMKCLAKKADVRYQSMQEVQADLELAAQGQTPAAVLDGVRRASSTGSALRTGTDMHSQAALAMDVGDVSLPQRSNKGLILGGAALLLALAVAGGFMASGGEPEKKPEPVAAAPVEAPKPVEPPPAKAEPAQDPAPAPEVEKKVKVHITTSPARVEVHQADALLGRTPFNLPRPKSGEPAVALVLKADGYKDLPIRVTYFTQEELHVELEKVRRSSGSTARPAPTPAPDPDEKKPTRKPPSAPSTEVLDPWSN